MLQVLIPLKPLAAAKRRLAPAFGPRDRRVLMLEMAAGVAAAVAAAGIGPVALVGSDAGAGELAGRLGVALRSDGGLPWNDGLCHAIAALDPAPEAVLIVAGDLPLVTAGELRALAAAGERAEVVIARAHDGGTNALLLRPPDAIVPSFGVPASAREHATRAAATGRRAHLIDLPGLALDVDTPADAIRAGMALPDRAAITERGRGRRGG